MSREVVAFGEIGRCAGGFGVEPCRGDRVTVPPPQGWLAFRFATGDAAAGWEELCRYALGNTRRSLETLQPTTVGTSSSGSIRSPLES